MIAYLRRLNDGLPGLALGILIYGFLAEIPVLIFAPDKVAYTIGLWYGVAIAEGMAINMASVIYDSVMLGDSDMAQKRAVFKSALRYVVVVILFFLLGLFNFGNLLMALTGVMSLKISAYMQPLMGMLSRKIFGDNWMYPEDQEIQEEQEIPEESNDKNAAEDRSEETETVPNEDLLCR